MVQANKKSKKIDDDVRLREIRDVEGDLRRERATILQMQPWYKRPGNILGIFAIIVSILLFMLNIIITQNKKELSLSYTKPSTLVFFTSSLKPKSRILFEDKPIEDLWRSVVYIKNTGTRAIVREDFKDGPLTFKILKLNALDSKHQDSSGPPFLLDVISKSSAGQRQAQINIKERKLPAIFEYLPTILNSGEVVELEIYTSIPADYDISIEGKLFEGIINPLSKLNEISTSSPKVSTRELLFNGIHQLFGAKWIAIGFFAIGLIALAFVNLALASFASDNAWEIEYIIALAISIFVTICDLVTLVFTTMT